MRVARALPEQAVQVARSGQEQAVWEAAEREEARVPEVRARRQERPSCRFHPAAAFQNRPEHQET